MSLTTAYGPAIRRIRSIDDNMWKLGDLEVDGRAVLGPMAGFTSSGYRDFMKSFGVALSYTVMTSDLGIIHNHEKTEEYVDFKDNHPTGVQLYGSDPETISKAASIAMRLNPDIDFFDINMGCPVPKIIKTGAGSALMKDPKRCGDIIRAVKSKVDVPVSAKIRLGWTMHEPNFKDVIDELQSADVDAVCVHPRTRAEGYSGTPHYDMIEGLQDEMSVPLIVSGNIYLLEDAISAMERTKATAVMVARGGVGNPFLITQIDRYFRTGERLPNPTISQQVDWCLELADFMIKEKGHDEAMRKFRIYAPKFISGCHRCRGYRYDLAVKSKDLETLRSLLYEIRDKMGDMRINSYGRIDQDDPSHSS